MVRLDAPLRKNMPPLVVCIDGLIGAGKSTLMDRLAKAGHACFPEPVSEWNLLRSFYEDPKLYGLPFQLQVLVSQFHQRRQFPDEGLAVVERCPETSRRVFAPLIPLEGSDLAAYEVVYDRLAYPVDRFVYLDVDPEVAYQRIRYRSPADDGVSLDYLRRLRDRYHLCLTKDAFVVNADRSPEVVEREVLDILDRL